LFNIPIRPNISIETINHKNVIVVFVDELAAEQKPLYFKNKGLPQGAYRRIGAADYKCTEDDLSIFYQRTETLDGAVIIDAELEDLSEVSIDIYRKFRAAVNPAAEELEYNNQELLRSINAIKKE
jgi:ATP-dependent DNA helicase RecG